MSTKIAVIGAGNWGKNLLRNFYQLGHLHSVCDTSSITLEEIRDLFPGVTTYSNFNCLLENQGICAVVIATPAETHFELAKQALLSNKDVFVEKPLALNANDGEELARLAQEKGRVLMVGHLLQYHPATSALKQMIHQGLLGKIRYISSSRLSSRRALQEGGVLWDLAPHDLSVILSLLNELPTRASAASTCNSISRFKSTVVSHLFFSEGVSADIFASWIHPFKEQKLVIIGDNKIAIFDDTQSWEKKLTLYSHESASTDQVLQGALAGGISYPLQACEPLKIECAHFIDCIEKRVAPLTDGREGVRVLKILDELQASLDQIDSKTVATLCA